MQYQILKFFQSIQNPFLSVIANCLSFLGEALILIVVAIVFYYGIDKKKAFSFISSMIFALIGTNGLKAIFRRPRPFVVHNEYFIFAVNQKIGYIKLGGIVRALGIADVFCIYIKCKRSCHTKE